MEDPALQQKAAPEDRFSILIADDEESVREGLGLGLRSAGYRVATATDGGDALRIISHRDVDLLLLDINMPGHDGLETLRRIKRLDQQVAVAIMTGYATIERAIDATRNGAVEFLRKPCSLSTVVDLARRIEAQKRPRKSLEVQFRTGSRGGGQHRLITADPAMRRIIEFIERIAPLPSTVLIEGETGTGKEVIAREIHARSQRREKPFLAFNCAAMSEELLESELFGYEKGAFTGAGDRKIGYFEAADGGTIFIDEIAEMGTDLQTKLLRVLQERTFRRVGGTQEISSDVRLIAATNRDLEEETSLGRFREDLYYRINVMKVRVPPLRERPEDIALLSHYFVTRFSRSFGKSLEGLDLQVLERFRHYGWRGNVRELQNMVERAVAVANGREISLADLPEEFFRTTDDVETKRRLKPYQSAKRDFEAEYLTEALEQANGNVTLAARLTGISRQHFYEKLSRHRIEQTGFRPTRGPHVANPKGTSTFDDSLSGHENGSRAV